MNANEAQFLPFIEGKKQFIIPIYQRTYSWTEKECRQIWTDITRAAQNDAIGGHFIGSIVFVQSGLYQGSGVQELLVVDGQQRMTTLLLLLAALRNAMRSIDAIDVMSDEINE